MTEKNIRIWFENVKTLLKDDFAILEDPKRVFNMDESGFLLAPNSDLVLGPCGRNIYMESTNSDKAGITTLFTVNGNGDFCKPLTLYKYERLPSAAFEAAPPFWAIGKSEKGWMTAEAFYDYFLMFFCLN